MVNFVSLAAEIVSGVWGTPATFNGFRVFGSVTARHSSSERQPNCGVEQRTPPGLYKPRTGRTGHTGRTGRRMNHAPAILAAPALIYSTHRLVVWIIVVHFHLYSLLDRYTALEV